MINDQFWHQDTSGVNNAAAAFDGFGSDLSGGDFDGDGYGDLAIGVPFEDIFSAANAGALIAFYGTGLGLQASDNKFFSQATDFVDGDATTSDYWGRITVSGDFNRDGRDDLAIVDEDGVGAVNVLYGSLKGLSANGGDYFDNTIPGYNPISIGYFEYTDIGRALAVGDLNGDGYDDLVVTTEFEWEYKSDEIEDFIENATAMRYLYGSKNGLTSSPFDGDIGPFTEPFGQFPFRGRSMVLGDFDANGRDDLVYSYYSYGDTTDRAGSVAIRYQGVEDDFPVGGDDPPYDTGFDLFFQGYGGIPGKLEAGDYFGASLAAGDFDGDGYDDLAVGSYEGIGNKNGAGAVNALYGSQDGLIYEESQIWHQNTPGIKGVAQAGDGFASYNPQSETATDLLGVGDFNGDGYDDLAVGVPGEDVGSITNAGAVNVIYGSKDGLTATGNQIWHQNSTGIEDTAENADLFGKSLGVADLNGDGIDDLAIGVPGEDVNGIVNAGAVNILYGSTNGLTAGIGSLGGF